MFNIKFIEDKGKRSEVTGISDTQSVIDLVTKNLEFLQQYPGAKIEIVFTEKPIDAPFPQCEQCKNEYQTLTTLYTLWYNASNDPAARGLFEEARNNYEKHRKKH
ncbi:MAG TPA: hypothetical protein VL443_08120 [Cyclobacteriaceae bacterium]|jgi:hypothetical protein|nr:hypothetical protein [Cyclobacteriaceae bacterium]